MADARVFCTRCGHPNTADAQFCSNCGASQMTGSQPSVTQAAGPTGTAYGSAAPVRSYQATSGAIEYGGFWARLLAFIIDFIVVSIVTFPLRFGFWGFGPHTYVGMDRIHVGHPMPFLFAFGMFSGFVRLFVSWLYWAGLESSGYQATLGKMALGLKVTDLSGQRISFARATGRHFSKILSSLILFFGYIMIAFTERKQGLHDMIAGTLVIKKSQ